MPPRKMVLPDRIELSTSPLPMECSTTELRQHARYRRIGPKRRYRRAVLATRPPLVQARGGAGKGSKRSKMTPAAGPEQSVPDLSRIGLETPGTARESWR